MKPSLWRLIVPLVIVSLLGLSTVWSTAPELASSQLIFLGVSLVIFVLASRFDARLLPSLAVPAYAISIIVLAVTFVIGTASRGSIRWIELGPFRFQSSEIVKPLLILAFSQFLATPSKKLSWFIRQFLIVLIPVVLVFFQPDLGSAAVISFVWLGMFIIAKAPLRHLVVLLALGSLFISFGNLTLKPYQQERLSSFLNPYSDPKGAGYNVIQSTIAIGSGRFLGRGVRQGTQSQLRFLPERHTDFIFASFAEEFGFLGVLFLLISFSSILFFLIRHSWGQSDFDRLLILGVFFLLFVQISVNLGMNLGLLPVTGITLPFLSYGGSSLIGSSMALGLVFSLINKPNSSKIHRL